MTRDQQWRQDGENFGWTLPSPAAWPLRLPVVRFVRFAVLALRVERHARQWRAMGAAISGYDAWILYAIARGFC